MLMWTQDSKSTVASTIRTTLVTSAQLQNHMEAVTRVTFVIYVLKDTLEVQPMLAVFGFMAMKVPIIEAYPTTLECTRVMDRLTV